MRVSTRIVALLLLGSGFSSLVYQTVWLRELRMIFGSSTPATAAVLGLFMAGLGFGSLFFGKRSDRHPNGLRLYAHLEFGIATAAALSPLLIIAAGWIYFGSGGSPALGTGGATLLRLILAAICLGVPTFLMGGTLPAAARAVAEESDLKRASVAILYGTNTIGAVLGVVVSTFFFIEILGNRRTLLIAALFNLLIAVVARAWSRTVDAAGSTSDEAMHIEPHQSAAPRPLIYAAAAIVGFVFLLMELVWYRMLAPILGGSTFTFGLILAMALLGIGLGGLLYGATTRSKPATLNLFAITCGAEALAIIAPFALGDRVAITAAFLRQFGIFGFEGQVLGWVIVAAIVVLPASIVAGFQFPLLIALLGRGRAAVGKDAGYAYAFNTLGAIGGSIAGGFGLLPVLTAPGSWVAAALLMVALSLAASATVFIRDRKIPLAASIITAVSLVLTIVPEGPTALWRHSPIGAGRATLSGLDRNRLQDYSNLQRRRTSWEAEGIESSVAIANTNGIAFIVNGKSDGHAISDAGTQVMAGLLGTIIHPDPRSALVVGLGTGSTAGWLALVPTMERVDVAELEPAIRHVAEVCAPVNGDALEQPNLEIIYGDAREILLTTSSKYDIIFSEPSNPYRAGIASLFTREFYRAAHDRLHDGGLFLQWVQAYEITSSTLMTIYRTLQTVFPSVETWQTTAGDLLLIGSAEPIRHDGERLSRRIGQEPYRSALRATWKVDDLEGFLAHHVATAQFSRDLVANSEGDINTDDRNVIEFGFARSVGTAGVSLSQIQQTSRSGRYDRPAISAAAAIDWQLIEEYRITSSEIGSAATDDPALEPLAEATRSFRERNAPATVAAWARAGRPARSMSELIGLGISQAIIRDPSALVVADKLEPMLPNEAAIVRATYLGATGEEALATALIGGVLDNLRTDPWIAPAAVEFAIDTARLLGAADKRQAAELRPRFVEPFAVRIMDERREHTVLFLSNIIEDDDCGKLTMEALTAFEPHVPWNLTFLSHRSRCYAATGHPLASKAERDLTTFASRTAEPFGTELAQPASLEDSPEN